MTTSPGWSARAVGVDQEGGGGGSAACCCCPDGALRSQVVRVGCATVSATGVVWWWGGGGGGEGAAAGEGCSAASRMSCAARDAFLPLPRGLSGVACGSSGGWRNSRRMDSATFRAAASLGLALRNDTAGRGGYSRSRIAATAVSRSWSSAAAGAPTTDGCCGGTCAGGGGGGDTPEPFARLARVCLGDGRSEAESRRPSLSGVVNAPSSLSCVSRCEVSASRGEVEEETKEEGKALAADTRRRGSSSPAPGERASSSGASPSVLEDMVLLLPVLHRHAVLLAALRGHGTCLTGRVGTEKAYGGGWGLWCARRRALDSLSAARLCIRLVRRRYR